MLSLKYNNYIPSSNTGYVSLIYNRQMRSECISLTELLLSYEIVIILLLRYSDQLLLRLDNMSSLRYNNSILLSNTRYVLLKYNRQMRSEYSH